MQLGTYEIPESRFQPGVVEDIKKIASHVRGGEIRSDDLAKILGYSSQHSGGFYRRLNSLLVYGLIAGRGKFRITELGESVAYPHNEEHRKRAYKEAILNVPLWNELFKLHKKDVPESIWLDLKNITGVTSAEAQASEKEIRRWYADDVMLIADEVVTDQEQKTESPIVTTVTQPSSQVASPFSKEELNVNAVGRIIVPGVGFIDVTDSTTFQIAQSYLQVMKERLEVSDKKAKSTDEPKVTPE